MAKLSRRSWAMKWRVSAAPLLMAFLLPLLASVTPLYTVTDLGTLGGGSFPGYPGDALNDTGQVVGLSYIGAAGTAFIWDSNNGMQGLFSMPQSTNWSPGSAINNRGEVVDNSYPITAFYWNGGNVQSFTDERYFTSINNNGQIVVGVFNHAYIWDSVSAVGPDIGGLPLDNLPASNYQVGAGTINKGITKTKPPVTAPGFAKEERPQIASISERGERAGTPSKESFVPAKEIRTQAKPQTAQGNWSVQVKAFSAKSPSLGLVKHLEDKGYKSYSVEAQLKGTTIYRVRVGYLATRKQAEELRGVLRSKEGFRDAFLVVP